MGEEAKMNYEKHFAFSLLGMTAGGLEAIVFDKAIGFATVAGFFGYFISALSMYAKKKVDYIKEHAWFYRWEKPPYY